jgi:hypothetical protein
LASDFSSDGLSMSTSTSRDWGEAERPLVDIVEWQTSQFQELRRT